MPLQFRTILAAAALTVSPAALAANRTDTRTVTCAAVQALVTRAGAVVLASSDMAYETIYRDSGACRIDETGAPAYEPTLDRAACFAGWRCKQRGTDFAN